MLKYKEFNIEYKCSIIFGVFALIFSFFVGLIVGNKIGITIIRSLTSTFIFSILGYLSVYIFKRFVPEVYEILSSIKSISKSEGLNITLDQDNDDQNISIANEAPELGSSESIGNEELDLGDKASVEDESSIRSDSYLDIGADKSNNQNYKDEKKVRYEPKFIAKAVRTMMQRDED